MLYNGDKGGRDMLEIGSKAPDFTLLDKDDREVHLSDLRGHKVVLYFYPKDNTPGCTRQACAYKEHFEAFKKRDVIVIGISKDTSKSHRNFVSKYELPFILLSDTDHNVIESYDVWKEKKLYGKVSMGTVRSTYVIDEEGIITYAKEKVSPDKDPLEVLEHIDG